MSDKDSRAPPRRRLSELVDATPDRRDRYVDFLRAFSITVVILGHWMGAVVEWHVGQITRTSAHDIVTGLWIVTKLSAGNISAGKRPCPA